MKHLRRYRSGLTAGNLILTIAALQMTGCAAPEATTAAVPPLVNGTEGATNAPKFHAFEKDIQAFEAADKLQFPPRDAMLVVGSSSVRFWTTLEKDFPEIPTVRRGFGGSVLKDSLYYADRIILPYKPRIVVVYAGSNDLAAKEPRAKVLEDYQRLVAKIHDALPKARIVFISVNPSLKRWADNDNIVKFNASVKEYSATEPYLAYLDSYSKLLGADGLPQATLLRKDGLHLNAEGYTKWVEIVKPDLLKIYRDTPPNL